MQQATLFDLSVKPLIQIHSVAHIPLTCKTLLNQGRGELSDVFTINPYRGCQFGCSYCYARQTHRYLGRTLQEFDNTIFVKREVKKVLMQNLDVDRLRGKRIVIGSATDPYQPAESRFGVTREILQGLLALRQTRIDLLTRSPLVCRDLELLCQLGEQNDLQVHLSLNTLNRVILRQLEPGSPKASERLAALRKLAVKDIRVRLTLMPVLPGLTDSLAELEGVIREGVRRGAADVRWSPLILRPGIREEFFRRLQRYRPRLLKRYRLIYRHSAYPDTLWINRTGTRVRELKRKFGVDRGRANSPAPSSLPAVAAF